MNNDIKKYSKLTILHNILKKVQQVSWNITKLEEKYPFKKAEEIGYDNLIDAYLEFYDEVQHIATLFDKEMKPKK